MKKKALASRSVADYAAFKTAIDDTLDRLGTTCRNAMTSLLTLRFETLHPASSSPA